MNDPVTVLISSRNRPLYLWACLDALYRFTRYPHRFILIDMASDDPLVDGVIAGFERRRMFAEVIRAKQNHPGAILGLRSSLPIGATISWNAAIRDLACTDPHAIPAPNAITAPPCRRRR